MFNTKSLTFIFISIPTYTKRSNETYVTQSTLIFVDKSCFYFYCRSQTKRWNGNSLQFSNRRASIFLRLRSARPCYSRGFGGWHWPYTWCTCVTVYAHNTTSGIADAQCKLTTRKDNLDIWDHHRQTVINFNCF